MLNRLEIVYFPDPTKWVAVSEEEPRVLAKADTYKQLADELNGQKRERAVVLRPAA